MLYRSVLEVHQGRPPVGCLCLPTGRRQKTRFEKRCSKAYDHEGRKIKYLKLDDGACNIKKNQFFGCNAAKGLEPIGCCARQDGVYIPANGARYFYQPKFLKSTIATCAEHTFEFDIKPYLDANNEVTISKLHLYPPISFAVHKQPPSLANQQTPRQQHESNMNGERTAPDRQPPTGINQPHNSDPGAIDRPWDSESESGTDSEQGSSSESESTFNR